MKKEAKGWSEIWEATKSVLQNIVALETNYKVLISWYLVPAWIAKYMSTYSPFMSVRMLALTPTSGGLTHWSKHSGPQFSISFLLCLIVLWT